MIKFINNSNIEPFKKIREAYHLAKENNQKEIQAILIASYSTKKKEVDSRYVNLKIIDGKKFIFFSNYNSPKSEQFSNHKQISALFYWPVINTQIRMKCNIFKTSKDFSDAYFADRSVTKNALAISSDQSKQIDSYEDVIKKYDKALKNKDLKSRPAYWGGFYFIPYYIEFWKGHDQRINKRVSYSFIDLEWKKSYLQP